MDAQPAPFGDIMSTISSALNDEKEFARVAKERTDAIIRKSNLGNRPENGPSYTKANIPPKSGR